MSETETQRLDFAKACASEVLEGPPDSVENPLTVLASPAWRGVEGDVWLAKADGQSTILKHYHPDTEFYVDQGAAIEAAEQAGKLGVGPAVTKAWKEDGLLALEELGSPWVAGGLHHAIDPAIRANVIEQKKTFQLGATLSKSISMFDEINGLYDVTVQEKITTHNDIVQFMDFAKEAETKLRACDWDQKPCHRDGNTANLMVHPDKSVQLIDFDLAANCDPFEDLGAHLVEYFETDVEARAGFEEWHGSFDEGLFQRSMIYWLMDDLRWGLIGSIMGARSPRTALEFTKYAAWRFIRLQARGCERRQAPFYEGLWARNRELYQPGWLERCRASGA